MMGNFEECQSYVKDFDPVMIVDVLFELRDFLGISWPELESAIRRNDIKRLLLQQRGGNGCTKAREA